MKAKKQIPYIWLGSIITLGIMFVIYAVCGVYPFGTETTAIGDGMAQYVPFLSEFIDKLKNGDSLFFSWHAANGTNFWATIAYYLSSPFNFIALLFDKSQMIDAFALISLIKVFVSSLTFSIYLKKSYGKNDISLVIFSVLWSFSAFLINTLYIATWMDAIIYFPLVIMGLKKLMDGESAWQYSLFLGLAITSNFYIGWIICIFCVIYFIYSFIADEDVAYEGVVAAKEEDASEEEQAINIFEVFQNSYLLKSIFRFGLSSLLAGGFSAVFSIPTFITLQNTIKGAQSNTDTINIADLWGALVSHVYPLKDISEAFNTHNYILCYAGIVSVILCVAHFFTKNISARRKTGNAFLLVAMWASFLFHGISSAWHGFGEPAGIMYRFAFVYSFVMLKIAYETFINIESTKTIGLVLGGIISVVCVAGAKFSSTLSETFYSLPIIVAVVILMLLFTILLIIKKSKKAKQTIAIVILACVIVETIGFNLISFRSADMNGIMEDSAIVTEVTKDLEKGESLAFSVDRYKFEGALMGGMLFGYNSTEGYSSMADGNFSIAIAELGSYGNKMNMQDGANEQTPIFNLLFPNRYYIDVTGNISSSWFRTERKNNEEYATFENSYTMPFMYTVSANIENWTPFNFFSVADNQRDVFKCITGLEKDAVYKNEFKNFSYSNCEYISNYDRINGNLVHSGHETQAEYEGVHNYMEKNMLLISCKIIDKTKEAYISYDSIAQSDGLMYIYVDTSEFTKLTITINGTEKEYDVRDKGDARLYEIGEVEKGEVINIKMGGYYQNDLSDGNVYKNDTTVFSTIPFVISKDIFEEGYNKLDAMSDTEMLEFSDTYVKAKVTSYEDGALYIPTSYDEGWTILIDGVETPLYEHESHILMTAISKGEHIVEMKYCPVGFVPGAIITSVSVVILVAWAIIATKRFKKEEEYATINETSVNEE